MTKEHKVHIVNRITVHVFKVIRTINANIMHVYWRE